MAQYEAYYRTLIGHLKDLPHGPYKALEIIVGKAMADSLAKKDEVTAKGVTKSKRAGQGEGGPSRSAKRRCT